jgi:hypothetical protein
VLAGEDEYWYGEFNGNAPNGNVIITYIDRDDDGVYSFQDVSYEASKESINHIVHIKETGKRAGWKEMGFMYGGRHEIVLIDEMDEEDEDGEWLPTAADEEEDDDDEEGEEGEEGDSGDEEEEEEDEESEDIIDSDDDESEEASDDTEAR